jgi:hypothetical protein
MEKVGQTNTEIHTLGSEIGGVQRFPLYKPPT